MKTLIFYLFLCLCALVLFMLAQELYMQAEEASPDHESFFTTVKNTIAYYFFLPRVKLQMLIRDLRSKPAISPDDSRAGLISNLFKDIVSKKEYVQFLVFIISAPTKRATRDLLRNHGYMSYDWVDDEGKPVDWKYFFVVGQNEDAKVNEAVRLEATSHTDILIGDFQDSYKNLVFKTLWLIEYATKRYDFKALVKCDDDTIINLSNFKSLMEQQDLEQPFYGGIRFGAMPVFRKGRYEVTKEEWEPDRFPPYCSGGGYVLNSLAIHKLLEVHYSHIQPVFLVEDAFMGVLAFHAQISPKHLGGPFRAFNPHNFCSSKDATLLHYVKEENQRIFMDNFKKTGRFCDEKWVADHKKH